MLTFILERKKMKYIKVTNKTNEVNRLKLEKLGFSTKRDNDETIGQFGSGIKFAPIAAVRKGMKFVFAGSDTKGDYTLEYIIKDDEGVPSVFYKYDDYEKPSSFAADAGLLSWENDFQIYREIVSNAIDESKLTGEPWDISVVDVEDINPVDGEFSVYITATESMIDINDNFDKYFSINRTPILQLDHAKVYEPIDNTFRVYCKGVLVYSTEKLLQSFGDSEVKGIFDYEFDDLKLNEERTVSSLWDMNNSILKVFVRPDDIEFSKILLNVFKTDMFKDYYEFVHIGSYQYDMSYVNSGSLSKAFDEMYPKHIVIEQSRLTVNVAATIKAKGYTPYIVHHEGIFKLLSSCNLPTIMSLFGDYFDYEHTFKLSDYPVLVTAIRIVNDIMPETMEVNDVVGVFITDDEQDGTLALTTTMKLDDDDDGHKKIMINERHAENANVQELISTFIHEWDHYRTGIDDGNTDGRMFRDLADQTIGRLVYELWKTKKKVNKL